MDSRRVVRAGSQGLIRIALDTNVLVYAEGFGRDADDDRRVRDALRLIEAMRRHSIFSSLAVQTVAEAHQVLIRKHHLNTREAQSRVQFWRPFSDLVPTDEAVFDAALELASNHHFQIYDAIILAAAVQVRCDLLLSEDMQDGFAWRGVTIANPFAATLEPRLARLLA